MAHLWVKHESERWAVLPLDSEAFALSTHPPRRLPGAISKDEALTGAILLRATGPEITAWVLIAGPRAMVRVNGAALSLGIRVISDRDQIQVRSLSPMFFSTESLAHVEPFPGLASQSIYCPRCRQVIEKESLAVQCPQCSIWHHQSEGLQCWAYAARCALCDQSSDLDAGYRWTPEDL